MLCEELDPDHNEYTHTYGINIHSIKANQLDTPMQSPRKVVLHTPSLLESGKKLQKTTCSYSALSFQTLCAMLNSQCVYNVVLNRDGLGI